MTKRRFAAILFGITIAILTYAAWCLRPFMLFGKLNYETDVPEEARRAVDAWYSKNKKFGRVTPSFKGALHFLASPFEDSIPPVSVTCSMWERHGAEVNLSFRGDSQRFKYEKGTWKAEDFQIRDSMNYRHPSNPRYNPSWNEIFFWKR